MGGHANILKQINNVESPDAGTTHHEVHWSTKHGVETLNTMFLAEWIGSPIASYFIKTIGVSTSA